jgi:hypothetical protein
MSPFTIVIIVILSILFALLSLIPVLTGFKDMDPFDQTSNPKTRAAH